MELFEVFQNDLHKQIWSISNVSYIEYNNLNTTPKTFLYLV